MSEISFAWIVVTIAIALGFDFMNGFHDAANSIATIVSTRVLQPLAAVIWAAFFNFIAFLIFGPRVAETISEIVKIEAGSSLFVFVVFFGVLGALLWNILTWWLGLPTSSSHALIGGLAGAALVCCGLQALRLKKIALIIAFIFISPVLGYILGVFFIITLYWILQNVRPGILNQSFRKGQLVSAALYSIGHGANDAQKTMGIILAVMIAGGFLPANQELTIKNDETLWIILSCQGVISLGTLFGGWRIVKTMGMKITPLRPIGGFCAELSSALSLFLATLFGIPVSTTHTITGAIIGVGTATTSFSQVKWAVATKIIWAWIFTIPGSGLLAALLFYLAKFCYLPTT
jgi:inorganic phosphate transporter, PiT family